MYSLRQLIRGLREPEKIRREIEKICGKIQNKVRGCDVMSEDWDNLLILDACRYDMFEELNTISGVLERRRSKGSATREFAHNNFSGRKHFDTVYINGNPNVSRFIDGEFHYIDEVWRTDWDDDRGTVMPDVMAQHTREAEKKFQNKRIVAHFMQPHHPFLGPTATRKLDDLSGNESARQESLSGQAGSEPVSTDDEHIWDRLERGDIEREVVRKAYYETLIEALPYIATLCEELSGKTVVTSDHGNLLDEQAHPYFPWETQRFAHPDYATAKELVSVPWLICEAETRKKTTAEPPRGREFDHDENEISEKLESLGYK